MNFPTTRMRRLRYNKILRNMIEDTHIHSSDLIYPIFVTEGTNVKEPIESMPGQFRHSIDHTILLCEELLSNNIKSIILFGIVKEKDDTGKISCSSKSIVPKTITSLKNKFKNEL